MILLIGSCWSRPVSATSEHAVEIGRFAISYRSVLHFSVLSGSFKNLIVEGFVAKFCVSIQLQRLCINGHGTFALYFLVQKHGAFGAESDARHGF